jgi:colanic acid biosynthesis glycosyl transferase WcaI
MGAPQARLYELGRRLQDMGHEITVLTGMPNYPTGRVFPEYRHSLRRAERMDGMRLVRTWLYPSISSRALPRVLSYLSFGLSSFLLGVWGLGRQDVVIIESPPLFVVPFALLISRLVRGRAVMMVSDIWPQGLIQTGHLTAESMSGRVLLALEKVCYKHSAAVALTNPGAAQEIRSRFPNLPVTVISNGVDIGMFRGELRSQEVRERYGCGPEEFLFGYCGLHGLAQGLEVILEAAARLRERRDIKFMMIGDGPTKRDLLEKARQMGLMNVMFYDAVPKRQMPEIVAAMDVSMIPLAARMPGTMPSKVYEALASGVPVLAPKGCEAEALVNGYDVGACYEPRDVEDFVHSVVALADRERWNRQRQNCLAACGRFDRTKIAARTERVLQAIADRQPIPSVEW